MEEHSFFSSIAVQKLLPTVGGYLRHHSPGWRLTVAQADHLRCKGVRAIINTAGTGNGKTLAALLQGAEQALSQPNFRGLLLTAPTNGLLLDLHRRALQLRDYFPDMEKPLQVEAFTRSTGRAKRRTIKEQLAEGSIDFLIMTLDMFLMSLMGSTNWEGGVDRWGDYRQAMARLSGLLLDEPDYLSSRTLSLFGILLRYIDALARREGLEDFRIHVTSATIPDPMDFMRRLLGHDEIAVITGAARHGVRNWRIFQDELLEATGQAVGSAFEEMLVDFVEGLEDARHPPPGQAMFVVNDIAYIEDLNDRFQLTRRGIVIAHGGLPAGKLAENLATLQAGKAWGVLTTSILEIGYDLKHLAAIAILGLPAKRSLWQLAGRVARDPNRDAHISLFLRRRAVSEVDYLVDEQAIRKYIFEEPITSVSINYGTPHCGRFMLLVAPLFGIQSLTEIEAIFHDVPDLPRLLRRVSRELFAKGQLRLISPTDFQPTSETTTGFFGMNLRGTLPRFQVLLREPEQTAGVEGYRHTPLGTVNARQLLQKLLPGQPYRQNRKYYVCEEIHDTKVFVRRAAIAAESNRYANNPIAMQLLAPTKRRRKSETGIELAEVILRLSPQRSRICYRQGEEVPQSELLPEQRIHIDLPTMACGIPLGQAKRSVATLLAAILKMAIQLTLAVDPHEIEAVYATTQTMGDELGVQSRQRSKIHCLHLLERNAPNGLAELVFHNSDRVLRQAQQLVDHCGCQGEGCRRCCGADFFQLSRDHWPERHAAVGQLLRKLLDKQHSKPCFRTGGPVDATA